MPSFKNQIQARTLAKKFFSNGSLYTLKPPHLIKDTANTLQFIQQYLSNILGYRANPLELI